jgi:mRNA interferase YafQ
MYQIIASKQFGKDYKKSIKKHLSLELLDVIILSISENKPLPVRCKVHKLEGEYKNSWECHIQPDWLLIWKKDEKYKTIQLIRTGTQSELFE